MITQFFMGIGQSVADWFLGLFGTGEPPAWLSEVGGFVASLLASVSGLGAWVPWAFAITVAGVVSAVWLSGFLLKAVRWLVGLIPTMGGG